MAVLTETASWSGSVDYSDLATNYKITFDSSHPIVTREYNVNILPTAYNYSTNYTLRSPLSGSDFGLFTGHLAMEYTGSEFQPYITQINLWQDGVWDEPVIQATLPRPIRKSEKINTTFKIKLDF